MNTSKGVFREQSTVWNKKNTSIALNIVYLNEAAKIIICFSARFRCQIFILHFLITFPSMLFAIILAILSFYVSFHVQKAKKTLLYSFLLWKERFVPTLS